MLPVLIAGGGIGGLTLALALAQHGVCSTVLEARAKPPREGAGIQLGPNATRLLARLGVANTLQSSAVSPECIIVYDGLNGLELNRLPLGNWIAQRYGAPYWVVHRGALQNALWSAAEAEALITLEPGRNVQAIQDEVTARGPIVGTSDGRSVSGSVLVGADGLWSRVRAHVNSKMQLSYTGVAAARALVPRHQVDSAFAERATGVWLAPKTHVVHYPVDGGARLAIVAISAREELAEGWNVEIDDNVIAERFYQMPKPVRDLLYSAQGWRQWALLKPQGPNVWYRGRSVLIGDAAHPILPFLAQGGAMAIEDAVELANKMAAVPGDPASVFATFAKDRKTRIERVQAASIANGQTYHLDGIAAAARNLTLRMVPSHLLMRRYDWIYGYVA